LPVERKPLFRPDVLRQHLAAFAAPPRAEAFRPKLHAWADLISSGKADKLNEKELLPDFLTDFFQTLLGYTGPAGGSDLYTFRREKLVEVDGKFADAVIGHFDGSARPVAAVEGEGTRDPLDRPFAGRRISAVDQGYRYAINLRCDWIVVTSMRQTRLLLSRDNPAAPRPAPTAFLKACRQTSPCNGDTNRSGIVPPDRTSSSAAENRRIEDSRPPPACARPSGDTSGNTSRRIG
jgi:hypothetical protein